MFDYHNFIQEQRSMDEYRDIDFDKYEQLCGPLGQRPMRNCIDPRDNTEIPLTGEPWFNVLVRPFPAFGNYIVPEALKDDWDWSLLSQLLASSSVCDILLERHQDENGSEITRLKIEIISKKSSRKVHVDELWGFQVLLLFEKSVLSHINSYLLWKENKEEQNFILKKRLEMLNQWRKQIRFIEKFHIP